MQAIAAISHEANNADHIECIKRDVQIAHNNLSKFAADLAKALELIAKDVTPKFEPTWQMSSDSNFTAAAQIDCGNAAIAWLKKGSLEKATAQVQTKVLRGAQYACNQSTSQAGNAVENAKLAVWAELLERMTGWEK